MNLRHTLPFLALLSGTVVSAQNEGVIDVAVPVVEDTHDPNEPLTIAEVMPEFPGGKDALFAYIGKNLKYPERAQEEGIEGVVYVTFVVEADGKISGVSVLRGIGGGCNEEAVRVVSGMPNWTPGMQAGKPVWVKYNLPIRYKLAGDKK
ncbi:MAG: energy transducer TonB [Flavobacteriales bacterium]|jgi:protein TonB|nr:energy transducer TonB [Flavobacteriales bacterium]